MAVRLSFRSKLLASHVGLVLAVGLVVIYLLDQWLSADLVRQLDQRLEEQARGAIEWAEEGGRRHPEKVAARIAHIVDAEVTLFDSEGAVIGASTKEARADVGPEVAVARGGAVGRASRARAGQEYHYVAIRGAEGIVIRLGVPLSEVNDTVAAMRRRLLFASALAVLAAMGLGFLASRVASRPLQEMTTTATRLARGDFRVPMARDADAGDEFGVLQRALKSLAEQLEARIGDLVAERDRLTAILSGMVEGVLVIDKDGRVIVANPAADTILGASSSVVGRALNEAVKDDDARTLIAQCMQGEVTETDLEVLDRRGTSIAVYVRPLPESAEGAVVAVLRDMTALRKLMTMRRDFVANVSHELRTPVTSIQGYAETLLRGTPDAETSRQFLEIVHRQAQRIGTLVEQLLALSELESRERNEIAREPVAVVSVARHVAEAVRVRATARGVSVAVEMDEDLVVAADPDGLERALINLVDNAIKYGKEGGAVRVTAARDEQPLSSFSSSPRRSSSSSWSSALATVGPTVSIRVSDDGQGIAPEHLPRLFERFYRVDPGRSRQHGGAGLGLSIVRHLVESMDGAIRVESAIGAGTTFVITLPTEVPTTSTCAGPGAPASAGASAGAPASGA